MQSSFLSQCGVPLIKNGYNIIPIKPGAKYPGLNGWQKIEATPEDVKVWAANGHAGGGVGVLAERTPGCDIDILDPVVVDRSIKIVSDVTGVKDLLERTGRFPKTLLPFRAETPFTKVMTPFYISPDGHENRVEILGKGQQWVAYHIHPDTNEPYEWGPKNLLNTPQADLPVLTHAQAVEICRRVQEMFEELGWKQKGEGAPGGAPTSVDPLDNVTPPADLTDEEFIALVDLEDFDDRDNWIRVGMICFHQYQGDVAGYEIWRDWSQQSDKYDPEDTRRVWRSFTQDTSRRPVTARSLIEKHKEALKTLQAQSKQEQTEDLVQQFVDRYVFVTRKNLVCDLTFPPYDWTVKIEEFRNETANQRVAIPAGTRNDPDKIDWVPAHKLWLVHEDRQTAAGEKFDPSQPAIFTDRDGIQWVNTFYMPPYEETEDTDRLDLFFKHIEYLIKDETDREWFLDWMAFNIQHPNRRSMITPLHISTAHGTGRGWIVRLIEELLGSWNCTKVKMQVLAGEGGAGHFQDFFDRSLFCSVEEIRESTGKGKFEINDQIRDYLTENRLEVNVKHGTKQTQQIYTNFFFMSNHPDALVLTKEDRRIYVIQGPFKAKPESYYQALYTYLEDQVMVAQLFHWLKRRCLKGFLGKSVAPMNTAKRQMISSNQNSTDELFHEFMDTRPSDAMGFNQIKAWIFKMVGGDPFAVDLNEFQLRKLLQHSANYSGSRLRYSGGRECPWIFDREKDADDIWLKSQMEKAEDAIHNYDS